MSTSVLTVFDFERSLLHVICVSTAKSIQIRKIPYNRLLRISILVLWKKRKKCGSRNVHFWCFVFTLINSKLFPIDDYCLPNHLVTLLPRLHGNVVKKFPFILALKNILLFITRIAYKKALSLSPGPWGPSVRILAPPGSDWNWTY